MKPVPPEREKSVYHARTSCLSYAPALSIWVFGLIPGLHVSARLLLRVQLDYGPKAARRFNTSSVAPVVEGVCLKVK